MAVAETSLQKKRRPKAAAKRAGRRTPGSSTPKRKRRSSADILNRIVQAAGAEFKRYGFDGTTTAAIARKAEVTEAQLFRYFGSKSNLFRETIFKPLTEHFERFMNEHLQDIDKTENLRDLGNLYATELQRFIGQHSQMLTSLVVAQTYDSGVAHGVSQIDSLRTYFDRGASLMTRRLKGKAPFDPRVMVRVTFATVLACVMFKDWIFPRGLASEEQITTTVNYLIMEGIGS